jgi:glycosyltransferase involved in cell wall biosynthesis
VKILVVAPQLGFEQSGRIVPGGLLNFGRCVARVLASCVKVEKLGVWCQVDPPGTEVYITKMLHVYSHSALEVDIRCFGGSKLRLGLAVIWASVIKTYDHVIYLLVNQAVLANIPCHLPYTVWEIGQELFEPVSHWKYSALAHANRLLSISQTTNDLAIHNNPGLPAAHVVYLCLEPPLFDPELEDDPILKEVYYPSQREPAVFILGNLHQALLYKGHQELISGWAEVIHHCPQAELWIGSDGDGRPELELLSKTLPESIARQIHFLGRLADEAVHERFRRCRIFAMPSSGEGFGLVFVEAARYGIPCIGGKHDSVKEIVLHGETGLLVEQEPHDVASACIRLLTDDDLAKRMGEAGRERYLNNFQFSHFRERLLHALELNQ